MKANKSFTLAAAALAAAGLLSASSALAADHNEAPLIREDPTADINDIYVFLNPGDSSRLVFAMTVNPGATPEAANAFHFSPHAHYAFRVDSDGDVSTTEDLFVVDIQGDGLATPQTATLTHNGADLFTSVAVTAPSLEPTPNSPAIADDGTTQFFAGPRDDPFFFDFVGFNRFLGGTGAFSGTDSFAGYNVSAIVFEIPLSSLSDGGAGPYQIWGITTRKRYTVRRGGSSRFVLDRGPYQQIERMGNPAVATALIPSGRKDEYNFASPANDAANFAGDIVAALTSLGTDATNIGILASVAVPDTLKVDPSSATNYPNGRSLEDDVIDTLFFFIFNQPSTPVTDGVDANDVAFPGTFPYLAEPHQAP